MAPNAWKDYFTFTKSERISVYILLCIIIASIILPYFYRKQFRDPVTDPALQEQLNALLKEDSVGNDNNNIVSTGQQTFQQPAQVGEMFPFDPNTLGADGFRKLGLRDKTINTIINYRNKGGRFAKPSDIKKIYGLREEEADRLIPYIRIHTPGINTANERVASEPAYTKPVISKIDINTATEEEFKSLPGIGDVLSKRIVKFRNSIHGFESIDDLRKTYGLSDTTFQKIRPMLTITPKR
ncbi:helix-hairpin-helix domain-containing protein [Panacibacter sp. DH6]|uniref:Helix-hairpin-helix domain-containing protein n=1 Tax=Panacibacter microcysteis TaxID=2793269 RepID=A0A931GYJ3_9BACT|nr:helix-hairpin-helix domain-containing protein [Panacibacter microcysteis]MBG9376302.1 helix-hairpin-helix domain-containing protein [Panacibacter microcysteis]